jgi:predicted MPP superfamily phosphohydrolase
VSGIPAGDSGTDRDSGLGIERRRLRVVLGGTLLCVALGVLACAHAYVARRLVLEPEIGDALRTWLLGGICALAALLVLEPIAQRRLPRSAHRWIAWPASLWLGVGFLLVVTLGVSDLVLWLAGIDAHAPGGPAEARATARAQAWFAAGSAALAGAVGLVSALRPPRLQRAFIALRRWPPALDGLRIVQLSDLHVGPILGRRFVESLVARCNALAPDLVVITGDLADGSAGRLRADVEPLRELRAPLGVFFVTGNHDFFSGVEEWMEQVASLGIRVLANERVGFDGLGASGDAGFDLAGVHDRTGGWLGGPRCDLAAALAGRDPTRPLVLLAHDPQVFREASRSGVDLQLSGHTHDGQIWPFRFVVRLATRYLAGRYTKNGSELYVSRGTGSWGPPMRLFAPAELTEITVCGATR